MEEDPHQILEGLLIAGYAIGASRGYIYIRGEYPNAFRIMNQAVAEAYKDNYLGSNLLGTNFSFDIELRLGAGAYICGEETALFESIEGKRGFPRLKPPFPTTHGLFGQPTVINNVETLMQYSSHHQKRCCSLPAAGYREITGNQIVLPVWRCGSSWIIRSAFWSDVKTPAVRAWRVVCIAGRTLKAVLFGGAAGAFATEQHLDVRMSFEDLRSAGLPLGSGVVMAIDDLRDLREFLYSLGRFFAHESCGKCFPCQIGTQRQYEILERVSAGNALPEDASRLADVGWTMSDASICGLGQTAATAVLSALKIVAGVV